MSQPGPAEEAREIARVLIGSLAPVVAPQASRDAVAVAREVAQMLALEGLDRVLAACEPHVGGPWPATLTSVLQRLARLSAAAEEAGSIAPFERADPELAALAAELEAVEWSPGVGDQEPAVPTLPLADVLEELPALAGEEARALQRVRFSAPVAAALRAALDWLAGSEGPRRPSRVSAEDSMFEVWVSDIDPLGLHAASEVLATVDGNLGPAGVGAPPGTWRVRVPAHVGRETFLMVMQGGLSLALPWHAVLHVHLMPAEEIELAQPAAPTIAPLAPLTGTDAERPVVMLAHGLRRAWLVADRLVWRFPADPCPPISESPAVALTGMVRTDEGESWWRVDVARLLAGVAPLPVPDGGQPPASVDEAESERLARVAHQALEELRGQAAPIRELAASDIEAADEATVPGPARADDSAPAGGAAEPTVEAPPAAAAPAMPAEIAPDAEPTPAPAFEFGSGPARHWHPRVPHESATVAPPRVELIAPAPPDVVAPPRTIRVPGARPSLRLLARRDVESLPETSSGPPSVAPAPPREAPPAEAPTVAPPPREESPIAAPAAVAPPPPVRAESRPATPVAPATESESARPRRALIAEDSMMARLFLVRLLQKHGFVVDTVDRAAALADALARGPWGVVCLDVELPDARGRALVNGVRDQLARRGSPAALVALVRDTDDLALAREAGIVYTLRKPFAEIEVDGLVTRLGLEARW